MLRALLRESLLSSSRSTDMVRSHVLDSSSIPFDTSIALTSIQKSKWDLSVLVAIHGSNFEAVTKINVQNVRICLAVELR
jgi:hypothetical protein